MERNKSTVIQELARSMCAGSGAHRGQTSGLRDRQYLLIQVQRTKHVELNLLFEYGTSFGETAYFFIHSANNCYVLQ